MKKGGRFEELEGLVRRNRSCRRFFEEEKIERETLEKLVNLARLSPSGANLQPLKYILSHTAERNEKIFRTLSWAGYLPAWGGPKPGERPGAYIVILCDKTIRATVSCDHGIAAQSIMLGAAALDLGGCMIGSIRREELKKALGIDEKYDVLLVLALGRPREKAVLEGLPGDGSIKYYRDKDGGHHVPKRSLEDLIIGF